MNKEALQELAMGAALVLLAYATYRQFRPAPKQGAAAPTPSSQGPAKPVYSGSPFTALTDLLNGGMYDVGSFQGRNYLDEIAEPALSGKNGGKDSIFVKVLPWD